MNDPVIAAIITGSVTVFGFIVQGLVITRYIDQRRSSDLQKVERLKVDLSREAQMKLEEYKLELAQKIDRHQGRRTSLITLVNMGADCREAAKELCKFSKDETGEERVLTVTHALHRMSPFFELLSKEDPASLLTKHDREEAKLIRQQLVKMILLMDLARSDDDYWKTLTKAHGQVDATVKTFHAYYRESFPDEQPS